MTHKARPGPAPTVFDGSGRLCALCDRRVQRRDSGRYAAAFWTHVGNQNRPGLTQQQLLKRNAEMQRLYRSGETLAAIARMYGLSRGRVAQIAAVQFQSRSRTAQRQRLRRAWRELCRRLYALDTA